jgi:putative ABC transport system permease protein
VKGGAPRRSLGAEALFSAVLLAYPRAFRRHFGGEMRADFRARTAEPFAAVVATHFINGLSERWDAMVRWSVWSADRPHLYEPGGRRSMFWDTLRSDFRHTLRIAVKAPLFTALTILTLALGIGATSSIFAVVNGVLLRSLPYGDTDRLVNVWSNAVKENRPRNPLSPADFLDFKEANATLDDVGTYFTFVDPSWLHTDTGVEATFGMMVSPNLFPLLGRAAAVGRTFNAQDEPGVVVLSDGFWRRRFGGDRSIIGQRLHINDDSLEVIGVMPADFVFPYGGMLGPSGFTRVSRVDIWKPIAFSGPSATANRIVTAEGQIVRSTRWLGAIGKLKPGVSASQAEADLRAIAARLEQEYPDSNKGFGVTVVPTMDQTVGGVRSALLILLAGIGCVLLMASVNVANLLLARSIAREKELATRAALGAGQGRLARQLLTESVLFSVAGGILGLLLTKWGMQALIALAPPDLPRMDEVTLDARVVFVTALTTIVTGVLVGLLPALSSASVNPRSTLAENSRGTVGGTARRRARAALVVAEVALAVALTTGAGLLIRSFVTVLNVNPGFETEHLLTWQMSVPTRLTNAADRLAFYQVFFARMDAIPGVVKAGGTTRIPLGSTSVTTSLQLEDKPLPVAELPEVQFRRSMHNYFEAMGIPIVRGRSFSAEDGPAAAGVAVINQTLAQKFFKDQDPIGQHVRTGTSTTSPWLTVIGVIGDIRHGGLEEEPQPELYITYQQNPPVAPFIVLRTTGDPSALIETVRAEARQIDKELPLYDMRTMSAIRAETMAQRRFILVLVVAFGALALGLAAIGVYGVMSLVVSERTREVGVRLALGAHPAAVLGMIVRQAVTLAGSGAIVGVAVAAAVTPLMASQLFGVPAIDPLTFVTVPLLLVAIATVAAVVPGRRAMLVDPMTALRYE